MTDDNTEFIPTGEMEILATRLSDDNNHIAIGFQIARAMAVSAEKDGDSFEMEVMVFKCQGKREGDENYELIIMAPPEGIAATCQELMENVLCDDILPDIRALVTTHNRVCKHLREDQE